MARRARNKKGQFKAGGRRKSRGVGAVRRKPSASARRRRASSARRRRGGMGSIVTVRRLGMGAINYTDVIVPVLVGGGVAIATTLAIKKWLTPDSDIKSTVVDWAPLFGLGAAAVASSALAMMSGRQAGTLAFSAAAAVALYGVVEDKWGEGAVLRSLRSVRVGCCGAGVLHQQRRGAAVMRSRRSASTLGKITADQEAQVRLEADAVQRQLASLRAAVNRALRESPSLQVLQEADADLRMLESGLAEVYTSLTYADQTTYVVLSSTLANLQEDLNALRPVIEGVAVSSLDRAKELRVVGGVVAVGGAIFVGWLLSRGRR